jgi:hypothetical protein
MEYRETSVWNLVQAKTLKENEYLRTEIRNLVETRLKLG